MPIDTILFFENKFYPRAKKGLGFTEDFEFPYKNGIAFLIDDTFYAQGDSEPGKYHFLKSTSPPLPYTLNSWIENSFGDSTPTPSSYVPGTIYKRMFRGFNTGNIFGKHDKITESFVSLRILFKKIEELFETVEPDSANNSVFGHKIREILLLASMEVESSWAAILKENEYPTNYRWTTTDYIKLLKPMHLDCYKIEFQSYRGKYPPIEPFKDWDLASPTQSLVWYDAYNKTKHDREENLKFASFQNAVQAFAAVVVMFRAQFGFSYGLTGQDYKRDFLMSNFRIMTENKYWQECYIPKLEVKGTPEVVNVVPEWTRVKYPF